MDEATKLTPEEHLIQAACVWRQSDRALMAQRGPPGDPARRGAGKRNHQNLVILRGAADVLMAKSDKPP
ncbi:hypothetical protein [Janthinobacterium sp. PSPC3-1]|uniref:hypothetical protein n=1 Tax=Janthinobacterium sp. PSPC3-1 TaxID=2804653 RepID=UPI003CFB732E